MGEAPQVVVGKALMELPGAASEQQSSRHSGMEKEYF